jgi:hypothetical protein
MSDNAYRTRAAPTNPAGPLFDLVGMHRVPDRDTSIAAARGASSKAGTNRAIALEILRNHPDGLTDFELSEISKIQQNSIGKRRGELVAAGLVRDSGKRRPSWTGSPSIVWVVTDAAQP